MKLTDAKPPTFTAAATAWLEQQKKDWITMIAAGPLADAALEYARQENWLLPYEQFHEVLVGKLFPSVDVEEWAKLIKDDGKTSPKYNRVTATTIIKAQAADDLAGHDAAIQRLCRVEQTGYAAAAILAALGPEKDKGQGLPAPAPPAPSSEGCEACGAVIGGLDGREASSEAYGIPEAVASKAVMVHHFTINGVEFYTLDRAIKETVHFAQIQSASLSIQFEPGDFGNCAVAVKLVNPK